MFFCDSFNLFLLISLFALITAAPKAAIFDPREHFDPRHQLSPSITTRNVTLDGVSGYLTSPEFPNNYPDNFNIIYYILAPDGYFVHITFYTFHTEQCCDILRVYEGEEIDSKNLLRELSGNQTGIVVESQGNLMTLQFVTDLANSDIGFYATYQAVLGDTKFSPTRTCPPTPFNDYDSTNYTYGIDTTPAWPYPYTNNANCQYWLKVSTGRKIKLIIESFWTEKCCDFLYIYEGYDTRGPLLATLSGSYEELPQHTIMVETNVVFMVFSSDLENNGPGFSILFEEAI
ncbi:unnamed protein product, partial [Mesorhabditis belari]|uniref:CUB domain-containing protein n=1 Tax=Mesorhabditis belari TaxID=2138241 RepID=A0AAF3F4N7_9BILA